MRWVGSKTASALDSQIIKLRPQQDDKGGRQEEREVGWEISDIPRDVDIRERWGLGCSKRICRRDAFVQRAAANTGMNEWVGVEEMVGGGGREREKEENKVRMKNGRKRERERVRERGGEYTQSEMTPSRRKGGKVDQWMKRKKRERGRLGGRISVVTCSIIILLSTMEVPSY
jgi:hypothetical protein